MTAKQASAGWLEGLAAIKDTQPTQGPEALPTLIRMPGGVPGSGNDPRPEVDLRVRVLAAPLEVREGLSQRGYQIIATNLAGGYLRAMPGSPRPHPERTLVLDGPSPLGGPMRVWLRPLPRGAWDAEDCIRFRWTALGAGTEPAELVAVVARLIGVELRHNLATASVVADRVLVYDAERMSLRHISRHSWSAQDARSAARFGEKPTTPEMPATGGDAPEDGYEPDISAMPGARLAVRSGLATSIPPLSMAPRSEAAGAFVLQGVRRGMRCGWVSETHLAFAVPPGGEPPLGAILDVAIPGDPISPRAIWVTGQVCRQKAEAEGGRVLVQVDLRRFEPMVPESYRALARHWQAQSRATASAARRTSAP